MTVLIPYTCATWHILHIDSSTTSLDVFLSFLPLHLHECIELINNQLKRSSIRKGRALGIMRNGDQTLDAISFFVTCWALKQQSLSWACFPPLTTPSSLQPPALRSAKIQLLWLTFSLLWLMNCLWLRNCLWWQALPWLRAHLSLKPMTSYATLSRHCQAILSWTKLVQLWTRVQLCVVLPFLYNVQLGPVSVLLQFSATVICLCLTCSSDSKWTLCQN